MSAYSDMHGGRELFTPGDLLQQGFDNQQTVFDTMHTYSRIQRSPIVGAAEGAGIVAGLSILWNAYQARKAAQAPQQTVGVVPVVPAPPRAPKSRKAPSAPIGPGRIA